MKKLILIFITMFLFVNNANAQIIETQINDLTNNIDSLIEKLKNNEANRLDKTYPIGSIYKTTTYSKASEVGNALGGVWEAYAIGKNLVGVDQNDTNFNVVDKTGGSSFTILSSSNLPPHTHSIPVLSGTAASAGAHTHGLYGGIAVWTSSTTKFGLTTGSSFSNFSTLKQTAATGSAGAHSHTVTMNASTTGSVGSATSFTNLSSYTTVYIYRRIG